MYTYAYATRRGLERFAGSPTFATAADAKAAAARVRGMSGRTARVVVVRTDDTRVRLLG
jgi:hypothetical protein